MIFGASPNRIKLPVREKIRGDIMARKKDPISQTRGVLYGAAKLLGDVNAVRKGTIGKRIARRAAGKATGRLLGKLFK